MLDKLTCLFRANAVPRLVSLEFGYGNSTKEADCDAAFIDEWKALSGRVKLERLRLDVDTLPRTVQSDLMAALENPAFCPSLRMAYLRGLPEEGFLEVAACLEKRQREWDALEAGAGVRDSRGVLPVGEEESESVSFLSFVAFFL